MTSPPVLSSESSNVVATLPEHSAIGGVHTFDVVSAPDGDRYFGYAGPFMDGPVDLFVSDDLREWHRYADGPVLDRPGFRWPSVVRIDGTYYMAIRSETYPERSTAAAVKRAVLGGASRNRVLFALARAKRKFVSTVPTSISLYRSEDGVDFTYVTRLVDPYEHGNARNQNPFLFEDPNSGRVGLLYYSGDDASWTIRHRIFDDLAADDVADDVRLLASDELLAAPAACYHRGESQYYLFAEGVDDRTGKWTTLLFTADDLQSPIREADGWTVFSDDEACPFPFVDDDVLFLFVSKRKRSGLFPYWEGQIHQYDLW